MRTVGELIEVLSRFDPGMLVTVEDGPVLAVSARADGSLQVTGCGSATLAAWVAAAAQRVSPPVLPAAGRAEDAATPDPAGG